jgi:2-isopropylmalate synthase
LQLNNSKLVAFGSTRRANIRVEDDLNVISLLKAETQAVAIFGKSWDFHVTDILRTTLTENLNMIGDTIEFMKSHGKEVVFDAEHFFDGYKNNQEYAIRVLEKAQESGAAWLVLCDTNGGTMPSEIKEIVSDVVNKLSIPIGIHCHNDTGMAVANSIVAVEAGAVQVQGTINGYGERCGNANLCTVIPNLHFKYDKKCIPERYVNEITSLSRYISELANMVHDKQSPYVGNNAFAHKGGMHIDAVNKNPASFEHIVPDLVGNQRRILMSEVSGKSTILSKIQRVAPWVTKSSLETQEMIDRLKNLEFEGYQFEGAESSFELIVRRSLGLNKTFFDVKDFRVTCEEPSSNDNSAFAVIKIEVDGKGEITASEGDGPVNAMDSALRKALKVFYPELEKIRLTDYKVRVLDATEATASKVRVHIETTDGESVWGTVGVSTNIVKASWIALVDSIEYFLYKNEKSFDEEDYEATV